MSQPKDRYINPDVGYYGQSAKLGDSCYINTGRTGEMTDFYEHQPATFSMQDHTCKCDQFELRASDHVSDSLYLGSGGDQIGYLDASTKRVDVITVLEKSHINFRHSSIKSSESFLPVSSFLYTGWIKMRDTVGVGHYEVNLWDHRQSVAGNHYGSAISLSSNQTGNNGALSVLIGVGNTSWHVHEIPTIVNWSMDTEYHVAVLLQDTRLKVYINNTNQLNKTVSSVVANQPTQVSVNTTNNTQPHPVAFESVSYLTTIPDLPETFINQHYNRVVPTPRSV